jgi:hypothetical protein
MWKPGDTVVIRSVQVNLICHAQSARAIRDLQEETILPKIGSENGKTTQYR